MSRLFFYAIMWCLPWFVYPRNTKNIKDSIQNNTLQTLYRICTVPASFTTPPVSPSEMLIPNTDAGCKKILPINKRYQEETLKVPIVKNPTPPLIISIKHVKQIENCSRSTASRRIKMVWDSLGKNQQQRITVEEYTTYYGYSITDILNRIS